MILSKSKIYDSKDLNIILDNLEAEINKTRMTKTLSFEQVIAATDKLGQKIANGAFIDEISQLNIDGIEKYIDTIIMSLKRENIEYKVKTELGENYFETQKTKPPFGQKEISIRPMPLGTILHIAAGNIDGLPAFSVAEGLITGNVNILKLPQADNGLSIKIIMKLIEIEPEISDFVYVFDTPSSDLLAIKRMAEISDGIVVWGGDVAVSAVRQFAPTGCKIIEWGHKLGFAYISGYEDKDTELTALAEHILSTKQLLCSSCQTIFIDTDSLEELHIFCADFLPFMEAAALKYPFETIDALAERTLRRYNENLENILAGGTKRDDMVYQGKHCSLKICPDKKLELSNMFGNCFVKGLPKNELFSTLREKKGYLQTAGLICRVERRDELSDLLVRSGVVRIMRAADMSLTFCGEAHDGEYALRRYTRIVNMQ
ncbi:MAG: acyl-CoA reductase [Clostridiales bacterium GWF2_36_10]|nr:MAG: acyl-CoA reductase [Clostridiales bacterium GWF2_36_10]HAN22101.1 acyl-CoA reductase [Clostridiales bacterium]